MEGGGDRPPSPAGSDVPTHMQQNQRVLIGSYIQQLTISMFSKQEQSWKSNPAKNQIILKNSQKTKEKPYIIEKRLKSPERSQKDIEP